jgi:hypothetical protein
MFKNFFRNRKLKNQERIADEQYLDAIEIIKETIHIYLELLAHAKENGNDEAIKRLETKLNQTFQHSETNWHGEVSIVNTIASTSKLQRLEKKLKIS